VLLRVKLIITTILLISSNSYAQSILSHQDSINFKRQFEKLLSKYGLSDNKYSVNVKSISQSGGQTAFMINNYNNTTNTPADLELCLINSSSSKSIFFDSTCADSDHLCLQVRIQNYGQEKALLISDSIFFIVKKWDGCHGIGNIEGLLSEGDEGILPNAIRRPHCVLNNNITKNYFPTFIFFKIKYTDRNGTLGLFREILDVTGFKTNVQLNIAISTDYTPIMNYLKSINRW
jgi:hypothetical protein